MLQVELSNTCAWLDTLYHNAGPDDGELVVIAPSKNRVVSAHRTTSRGLVAAAKAMHNHPGCYAKINLMDYAAMCRRSAETGKPVVGKQSEVRSIVSIHLDVDAQKGKGKYATRRHVLWCISEMPLRPTLVINSNGDAGGFHCYWCLRKPYRISDDECRRNAAMIARSWQDRLASLLKGKIDSTSNLDRVLRCVGVPRLDGGRVCLESCDFDALYDLHDFADVA